MQLRILIMERFMSKYIGASHNKLTKYVDHGLTYGEQVIRKFLCSCLPWQEVLDIGAGPGRDLAVARALNPQANCHAIEFLDTHLELLQKNNINCYSLNLETENLPFDEQSMDIVIANQILEHVKEIFWIMDQITRVLKVGGHLLIGVPNVASLHNRIGLLLGRHPTQAKTCSAHVRIFSKGDFLLFLDQAFAGGYKLKSFAGSQFYPFPPAMAQTLARLFPKAAFSIFFLLQKTKEYSGSFINYPIDAQLETNFKVCGSHLNRNK